MPLLPRDDEECRKNASPRRNRVLSPPPRAVGRSAQPSTTAGAALRYREYRKTPRDRRRFGRRRSRSPQGEPAGRGGRINQPTCRRCGSGPGRPNHRLPPGGSMALR
jgi:hypothetical protein